MDYVDRLIQLRKEAKLSQKDIGEYLGTPRQQITKYETRSQELPIRRLIELAKLYRVSVDWILGLSADREISNPADSQ